MFLTVVRVRTCNSKSNKTIKLIPFITEFRTFKHQSLSSSDFPLISSESLDKDMKRQSYFDLPLPSKLKASWIIEEMSNRIRCVRLNWLEFDVWSYRCHIYPATALREVLVLCTNAACNLLWNVAVSDCLEFEAMSWFMQFKAFELFGWISLLDANRFISLVFCYSTELLILSTGLKKEMVFQLNVICMLVTWLFRQ